MCIYLAEQRASAYNIAVLVLSNIVMFVVKRETQCQSLKTTSGKSVLPPQRCTSVVLFCNIQ